MQSRASSIHLPYLKTLDSSSAHPPRCAALLGLAWTLSSTLFLRSTGHICSPYPNPRPFLTVCLSACLSIPLSVCLGGVSELGEHAPSSSHNTISNLNTKSNGDKDIEIKWGKPENRNPKVGHHMEWGKSENIESNFGCISANFDSFSAKLKTEPEKIK